MTQTTPWTIKPRKQANKWLIVEDFAGNAVVAELYACKANARLIAAAPELLAALRDDALPYVMAYYKTLPDDGTKQNYVMQTVIEPIRAAIAKATGQ